jgi:hypothetical protein
MLYIYNCVALVLLWFFTFLFPGPFQFTGLSDNSWNMLYKLNVKPGGLVANKINICIFSFLGAYLMGFLISTGAGYLKSSDKSIDVMFVIFMALVGILSLLVFITPTLFVGAISRGKALLRVTVLVSGGLAVFFAYSCGYFECAKIEDVENSISALISFNPLGLVIIPAVFTIVFPIIAYSSAVSRARSYNVEELDDDILLSLGVADDMLVLEEGRNKFNVTISGPDLNDADFSIEAPDMTSHGSPRPGVRRADNLAENSAEASRPGQAAPAHGGEIPAASSGGRKKKRRRVKEESFDEYDEDY